MIDKNYILSFINTLNYNRKTFDFQLKKHHLSIYNAIVDLTSFLDNNAKMMERIYCLKNDIQSRPVCKICNTNFVSFNSQLNEYRKTCSTACTNKDPNHKKLVNKKLNLQRSEIVEKIQKTKLEKYGSKTYVNSEKAKQTKLEKYNNENFNNREKAKQTCLEKYNVENPFQLNHTRNNVSLALKKRAYYEIICNEKFDSIPLFSFEDFCNRENEHVLLKFKCKKCGNVFESIHCDGLHKRCPICYPNKIGSSNEEKEIVNFIKSICNTEIIENSHSIIPSQELDIYIPEKKLAIEFDGLYWHSDLYKNIDYHLNKTEECEKRGIQLIHIFENEWIFKQDIVKSRLKNLLNACDKRIYARKCKIKEVDSKISKEFQNENHIQGAVNSKINIGLFYKNELVSLMTFSKPRFNKKYEYELIRFCNKLGYHIPGAASKLLAYFEKTYKPKSLISYADRRWSKGNLYEKLGFKLDHISKPDYWYIFPNGIKTILESRIKYQKHKLSTILENFDPNKSEVENMFDNGYFRIFDCGNLVYEKIT